MIDTSTASGLHVWRQIDCQGDFLQLQNTSGATIGWIDAAGMLHGSLITGLEADTESNFGSNPSDTSLPPAGFLGWIGRKINSFIGVSPASGGLPPGSRVDLGTF